MLTIYLQLYIIMIIQNNHDLQNKAYVDERVTFRNLGIVPSLPSLNESEYSDDEVWLQINCEK